MKYLNARIRNECMFALINGSKMGVFETRLVYVRNPTQVLKAPVTRITQKIKYKREKKRRKKNLYA